MLRAARSAIAAPGWVTDKTKLQFQTVRKKTRTVFLNPALICLLFSSNPPEKHKNRDLTRLALRELSLGLKNSLSTSLSSVGPTERSRNISTDFTGC